MIIWLLVLVAPLELILGVVITLKISASNLEVLCENNVRIVIKKKQVLLVPYLENTTQWIP